MIKCLHLIHLKQKNSELWLNPLVILLSHNLCHAKIQLLKFYRAFSKMQFFSFLALYFVILQIHLYLRNQESKTNFCFIYSRNNSLSKLQNWMLNYMDLKLQVNKSHVCLYIINVWRIILIETINSKSNKVFYKLIRGKIYQVQGIYGR